MIKSVSRDFSLLFNSFEEGIYFRDILLFFLFVIPVKIDYSILCNVSIKIQTQSF